MPNQPNLSGQDKQFLADQAGLDDISSLDNIRQWGDDTYIFHRPLPKPPDQNQDPPRNSYLGEMIYLGNRLGKANPDFG